MCELLEYTREEMQGNGNSFLMDDDGRLAAKLMQRKEKDTPVKGTLNIFL
jgi:hypothetical protein